MTSAEHNHLVKFYGYTGEDSQQKAKGSKSRILRPRIVLELMEGGALDSLLYTTKWLPTTKQALQMSRDVADAMVYLHRNPDGEGKPISERTAAEQLSRR